MTDEAITALELFVQDNTQRARDGQEVNWALIHWAERVIQQSRGDES